MVKIVICITGNNTSINEAVSSDLITFLNSNYFKDKLPSCIISREHCAVEVKVSDLVTECSNLVYDYLQLPRGSDTALTEAISNIGDKKGETTTYSPNLWISKLIDKISNSAYNFHIISDIESYDRILLIKEKFTLLHFVFIKKDHNDHSYTKEYDSRSHDDQLCDAVFDYTTCTEDIIQTLENHIKIAVLEESIMKKEDYDVYNNLNLDNSNKAN